MGFSRSLRKRGGKALGRRRAVWHTCRMQAVQFEQSVSSIIRRESRYDGHAYFFLKESLDFTLKRVMEETGGKGRHVSGKELLEGFRDLALEQFGPMAATLMDEWGITECRDVGNMVFLLIEEQVFGRQESDKPEDFAAVFDFHKALREPFLPVGRELAGKV